MEVKWETFGLLTLLPIYNIAQVSQFKKGIIQDTTALCGRAVHTRVYLTKSFIFA